MNVGVIGAGIAGAAAAFEIARQGGQVTVFHDFSGASALYSGALDFEDGADAPSSRGLEAQLAQFAAELGVWALDGVPRRVATLEGNLRSTRGADRALLDLERCAGQRVAVVDVERDDWDAALLAKSFAASAWARRTHTEFVALPVSALHAGFERRIAAYDFAALHDAPERAQALLAALRREPSAPGAWLFGPWLGIERALAQELSQALGVPVGETTSAAGGSAGARFESARDRLLTRLGDVQRARVTRVARQDSGFRVELGGDRGQEFSALVLASGGVAAGGVVLERSFERRGGTGFRLSFAAPAALELDGEVLEGVSSLSNIDFVERGLDVLLKVGVAAHQDGSVRDQPGLFVAGDAIAGRARSALVAASSGILAARSALEFVRGPG